MHGQVHPCPCTPCARLHFVYSLYPLRHISTCCPMLQSSHNLVHDYVVLLLPPCSYPKVLSSV